MEERDERALQNEDREDHPGTGISELLYLLFDHKVCDFVLSVVGTHHHASQQLIHC